MEGERHGDNRIYRPIKPIMRFNVRLTDDDREGQCSIVGCCLISGARLVIADRLNKKLKLLDPLHSTLTKLCDTGKEPLNLSSIGSDKVAVVLLDNIHKVYNLTHFENTIDLDLGSITCVSYDGSLWYTGWRNYLNVYDLTTNRIMRTIPNDRLFVFIQDIALSGDKIYVVDYRKGLSCVEKDGQPIFQLSLEELGLSGASALAIGNGDDVFVSGFETNNVVKVKKNRDVTQILSSEDGINGPKCLTFDSVHSRLYIGGIGDQVLMYLTDDSSCHLF